MKIDEPQQIFWKYSDVKIHENLSVEAKSLHADGQTNKHDEANGGLSQFFKLPK